VERFLEISTNIVVCPFPFPDPFTLSQTLTCKLLQLLVGWVTGEKLRIELLVDFSLLHGEPSISVLWRRY